MGLMATLTRSAGYLLIERPARRKSYDQLLDALKQGEEQVARRFQQADPDNEKNHRVMTHIIGIEKWGQSRLNQIMTGEASPPEYDIYRPAADTPWEALPGLFHETRQETLQLATQFPDIQNGIVPHNTFGDLSGRGWLRYLYIHAEMESKHLR